MLQWGWSDAWYNSYTLINNRITHTHGQHMAHQNNNVSSQQCIIRTQQSEWQTSPTKLNMVHHALVVSTELAVQLPLNCPRLVTLPLVSQHLWTNVCTQPGWSLWHWKGIVISRWVEPKTNTNLVLTKNIMWHLTAPRIKCVCAQNRCKLATFTLGIGFPNKVALRCQ